MLVNAAWRARVIGNLGGEAALGKWEARHAKYQARKALPRTQAKYDRGDLKHLRNGKARLRSHTRQVASDIADCFRLAPLPRILPVHPDLTRKQGRELTEARRLRRQLRRELWEARTPREQYERACVSPKEI